MTKRIIFNFLIVGISIGIIYSNFANILQINRFIPNFFLIMPDISGLALDISTYPLIGFYSFIYCLIGYSISVLEKKVDFENSIVSTFLIFVYFIIKIIIFTIVGSIFLKPGEIKNYFSNIFLMQFIYTIILSIPIFKIYRKISLKNRKNF